MSISDDEVEAALAVIGMRVPARDTVRAALHAAAKVRAIREHATSSNGVGGFGPTPTIDPVFSSDIETMTPTDNLEAGAGDLVARLRDGVRECGLHDDNETELFDVEGANDTMAEAAAQLEVVTAERDEAKENAKALRGLLEYSENSIARLQSKWQFQLERADAAEAENARLREALEPFAEAADSTDANDDYSSASIWEHPCALDITIGHLRAARRARAALSQEAPK